MVGKGEGMDGRLLGSFLSISFPYTFSFSLELDWGAGSTGKTRTGFLDGDRQDMALLGTAEVLSALQVSLLRETEVTPGQLPPHWYLQHKYSRSQSSLSALCPGQLASHNLFAFCLS